MLRASFKRAILVCPLLAAMSARVWTSVPLLVVMVSSAQASSLDESRVPGTQSWRMPVDHLQYADIVVQGRVGTVAIDSVDGELLGRQEPGMYTVEILELTDLEVLRGVDMGPRIAAMLMGLSRLAGRQVVLCAYFRPGLPYCLVDDKWSVFVLEGGAWIRYDGEETISEARLKSRIEETLPQSLARYATLVVQGRVASKDSFPVEIDGHSVVGTRAVLTDLHVLKGNYVGNSLSIVSNVGTLESEIIGNRPPIVETGETWIAFLREAGGQLVVFGGANGLLLVQKDTLLYRRVAPYNYSVRELRTIAVQASDK